MRHIVSGTLGLEDMQRHVPVPFDLPAGVVELHVAAEIAPTHPGVGDIPHEISLSLWDPERPRGARHNGSRMAPEDFTITLNAEAASPGYLPGPLPPGRWTLWIDTHRILPPGQVTYAVAVETRPQPTLPPQRFRPAATADRGPGWYKGDLHGHTWHSDARWSVADYVAHQRAQGLDFTVLTDHNTTSGLAELQSRAGDDLLTIGGMELTTFGGHCLSLGPRELLDWRVRDGETMATVAARHMAAGAFFVIAHPMAVGHPFCAGCNWQYTDMMPGCAPAVEIWNGPWTGDSHNALALDLFQGWLNRGHRLVATGGSDVHRAWRPEERPGYTVVRADAFTEAGILGALSRGRAVISRGPRLVAEAEDAAGRRHEVGATLPSGPATLQVTAEDCPEGAEAVLVTGQRGAATVTRLPLARAGADGTVRAETTLAAVAWAMVELRAPDGEMEAVANPFFLESASE